MSGQEQHWQKIGNQMISVNSIKVVDRIIMPTQARIDALAKRLSGPLGQIVPIIVTKYLVDSWKVVAGATRLAAAKQLGWSEIEVEIINADNDFEYQLIEIDENLGRHDLDDD